MVTCISISVLQAVCEVLYAKKTGDGPLEEEVTIDEVEEEEDEATIDSEEDDSESEDSEDEDSEAEDSEEEGHAELEAILATKERQVAINKIRKIYKVFKRSPKSNDKLQAYNVKVTFLLFCTGWSIWS